MTEKEPHKGSEPPFKHSSDKTADNALKIGSQLVIKKEAFADCKNLKKIIFDPGSAVGEI